MFNFEILYVFDFWNEEIYFYNCYYYEFLEIFIFLEGEFEYIV